jgi:3-phenylpropionate/trans-cinnamate dioxygenase ferredoxin reductase subunit
MSGIESASGILIVGAGQAGMQMAVSLRDGGYEGEVTIVGQEAYLPYQRPPLSKAFLSGDSDFESLEFRTPEFYAGKNITIITGEQVVDAAFGDAGGTATTDSGRTLTFDRLALAPGSTPRQLPLPGADLDGVLYLRDLDDALALKARWADAKSVVVIGGGFIGLEVAAAARKAGKTVTVLEALDRLIARAVSPVTSEFYRQAHERRGTSVRLNVTLERFVGGDDQVGPRVTGVELAADADGNVEMIPADIVMVGIGVIARGDLAAKLGLETINGAIVVNEFAETSDPRVVAAGDAVLLPHPLGGASQVRLESVQNAVDQAKVAASTLLGKREAYRAVPWFWSDQADLKLQIAGLSTGFDTTVVRGSQDDEHFSVLYYRDSQLIAIDAINDPSDYMAVRRALGAGSNIPAELAADSAVPLKTLIVAGSREL